MGAYECHNKGEKTSAGSQKPYARKEYGGWIDADGDCQNTRDEVLIEESLIPVGFKTARRCKVISGRWLDPFTWKTFENPSKLDIDHMVPLKEAHISGGHKWSRSKKRGYANDLTNKNHLIAVSASANRSKGARDPSGWVPPNKAYHEEYAAIWIEIKKRWGLSFDSAEVEALLAIGR